MPDCEHPSPAGCYTCLSDRQLLALTAEHLCQILETGIPPVGLTDVNIVSSVVLTVQGDTGRTWTLDFASDQVDASGSVVALDAATLAALETVTVLQGTVPWTVGGSVGRTWDLGFATDQVDASGSVVALDAATLLALETITVLQGTSPWVVSATDLDIRNLVFATDTVDASGSVVALDAATLAALETITVLQGTSPWVVSAADLDIRNLVFATDKVDVSGSTVALDAATLTALENVSIDSVTPGTGATNLGKAEDSAHSSGDVGVMALTVRQDTPAALAGSNNEYQPFITDSTGREWQRSVPDRPSSGANRTYKTANISAQTADALLYTVTAAKTLYVTTLSIFVFNTSTATNGVLSLRDGTTVAGAVVFSALMSPAGLGAATAASAVSHVLVTFSEPLQFTAGMFLDAVSGTLTFSAFMIGYEE